MEMGLIKALLNLYTFLKTTPDIIYSIAQLNLLGIYLDKKPLKFELPPYTIEIVPTGWHLQYLLIQYPPIRYSLSSILSLPSYILAAN